MAATFAANRTLRISLQFRTRTFRISSLANKAHESSSSSSSSSSGPVRYIPKDYSQTEKTLKLPPLESCSEKKKKKEPILLKTEVSESRRGVFNLPNLDDASSLPVIQISESGKSWQDAETLAIELLAGRAFTEFELKKKLRAKKFSLDVVESVVADIKSRGLLNDGMYAETFSESRWRTSVWGPKRIKEALVKKGVNEVEAAKATKQVFECDDLEGESKSMQHGISKTAMDRLYVEASKQWLRGKATSLDNRKARIVRWLQYRGFNWDVTKFILRKLVAQCSPDI